MTDLKQLDELIKAGEKATQGKWLLLCNEEEKSKHFHGNQYYNQVQVVTENNLIMHFGDDETYYPTEGEPPSGDDMDFILAAANSRPLLKQLRDDLVRYRKVLRKAVNYTQTDGEEDNDWLGEAVQALQGKEGWI